MGSRRKKSKTPRPLKEDKYGDHGMSNKSGPARNLPKNDLGAVIFGCKNHTISECLEKKLFGLPRRHHSYVKNVMPGLTLFLFNYSDRKLHGIFEAVSPGQLNIDQYAWVTNEGTEITQYPAQVRVAFSRECHPLCEEQFKPIIAENYYAEKLFHFELDKKQSRQLVQLFLSTPLLDKKIHCPSTKVKSGNMFDGLSDHDADEVADDEFDCDPPECSRLGEMKLIDTEHSSALVVGSNALSHERKWSELFNGASTSNTVNQNKGLERFSTSMSDNSGVNWEDPLPFENEDTCLKVHIQGSRPDLTNLAENMTCLDEEVGELKQSEFEQAIVEIPEDDFVDNKENVSPGNATTTVCTSATSAQVLLDTQSTDHDALFTKLVQEIEGLKATQVQQKMRIDCLEKELADSKSEIQRLKSQYCELGKIPSNVNDHLDSDACKLPSLPMEKTVLIAGGFNGCSWLQDLSSYSPIEDHVIQLCPMSFPRPFTASALLNGELYILGGIHDKKGHATVESYNPMSNQWVHKPPLNKAKGNLAGASLYEKIFAIGGYTGVECCSEVEVFDLNSGRWDYAQPMHEKRSAPAAAEINGAIYVAGGFDERAYLCSVERYDPRVHDWTRVGNMNLKRGCHSLVPFKGKLYALGGYDGDKMTSKVEAFDPRIGSWTMEEPMHTAKGYFGSFVFEGKIYVIGGVNDGQALNIVECFEEGCGWQVMGLTGIGERCFFSSVVI